jgi:hypothetical protein
MQRQVRLYSVAVIAAGAIIAIACSDVAPAGPETPVPSFQIAACGEWSCAIGDCTNDPAIYGACCVAAADEGQSAQPKPSCMPDYCHQFPANCKPTEPGGTDTVPQYCFHDSATEVCADTSYHGTCPAAPNTWNQFSECGVS